MLKQGNKAEAATRFADALDITTEGGFTYQRQRALRGLWDATKDADIARAARYLEEYTRLTDSINADRNRAEMETVQDQFEFAELQRANREMEYNHRVQKLMWIAGGVLALLIILALVFIIRSKSRTNRAMRDMERIRDDFFANITHEFRTPLTAILGLTTDLANGRDDTPEQRARAIEIIQRQGNGLLSLVNQILDISRLRSKAMSPEKRRGNIASFVEQAVKNLRPLARHNNVKLIFSADSSEIDMAFVPDYISKIVWNLVSNALKHARTDGHVFVEMHTEGQNLVMRVADDGEGISHHDLPHIFKPFYVGEGCENRPSTGIGLALVKQLVDVMGGTISVASRKGSGSVFTVTLPMTHESDKPVEIDSSSTATASPTILSPIPSPTDSEADDDRPVALVVEDNDDIAYYIGSHLKKSYNIHYASNGAEALEKAREIIPDIIITDLIMPGMDGLELTRNVRNDDLVAHVPIIAVTAKTSNEDRMAGLKAGVDSYITKPFSSEELETRVAGLLERRRKLLERFSGGMYAQSVDGKNITAADKEFMQKFSDHVARALKEGRIVDGNVAALMMGMSSRRFYRRVKEITGDTPSTYINRIRIRHAKTLLDSRPDLNINEISIECGFEGSSYFCRIFRQIEGVTPMQYRNRVK